ncbi:MAG: hypothetical protein R3B93_14270 [Bacteroidia bacterium]
METQKFHPKKIALIIMFAGIFILPICLNALTFTTPVTSISSLGGGITIVMEDDILFVNSGEPEDPVDHIVVSQNSEVVHTENNCGSQVCTTSLAHLESGIYMVEAFTEQGNYKSQDIVVN